MKRTYILLLILSICFYKAEAQDISFNMPFIEESSQPEMFFMEPNYNKNNQLTHYSLANILKVEYQYNKDNTPKEKITYMWSRHNYVWDVFVTCKYKYDESGDLIEERTERYGKPLLLKTYSVSTENNIKTIEQCVRKPKMGYNFEHIEHLDTIRTTRLLNKNNNPDLVIHKYLSTNRYLKTKYTYNNNQQNTKTESYFSADSINWSLIYTTNIKYEKNKVVYTYAEEPGRRRDMYGKPPKPSKFTYTFTFDDNKRITESLFLKEKKSIINKKIQYDNRNRTIVTHEQNLTEELLKAGGVYRESMKGMEYLKYNLTYNDNCTNLIIHSKNKKGAIIKMAEQKSCYSPENLLIFNELKRYDNKGKLDNFDVMETKYEPDNLSGEMIEYFGKEKTPNVRKIFKNNTSGQMTFLEVSRYSFTKKVWIPEDKTFWEYDKLGNETLVEEYRHNYNEWEGKKNKFFEYDKESRVISETNRIWANYPKKGWVNTSKENRRYDIYNNKCFIERYKWDRKEVTWDGIFQDSIVYNELGEKICEIDSRWDTDKQAWSPNSKSEFENNTIKFLVKDTKRTLYKWDGNKWQTKRLETKYADKQYLKEETKEWNANLNIWETSHLKEIHNPRNGDRIKKEYNWNIDLQELQGIINISTKETNNHADTENTYSMWDYKKKDWNLAFRESELVNRPDKIKNEILETYDTVLNTWLFKDKYITTITNDTNVTVIHYIKKEDSNTWIEHSKVEFVGDNQSTFYIFDNNKWQAHSKNIEADQDNGTSNTFIKWNTTTNNWENLYQWIEKERGEDEFFQWNKLIQKWDKAETHREMEDLDKEIKEFQKVFSVELKFSYDSEVEKNIPRSPEAIGTYFSF